MAAVAYLFSGQWIKAELGEHSRAGGSPVNSSSNEPSPVSEAMVWVSRILAVAAMMVLPGLAGQWLDKRWGTGFLGLVGFAFGMVSGIAYLLTMTKLPPRNMKGVRDDSRPDDTARGDKD